jgi:predicted enzyme related to lactoylglutathione lyase
MAKVLGLGGVFFKAEDPAALRGWYARVLGLEVSDWGAMFKHPKVGAVTWAPFEAATHYFEPSQASFMINFIVDDLDGVLARAAGEGVEPTGRQDDEGMGKFAWIIDPVGVKIELWEPSKSSDEA